MDTSAIQGKVKHMEPNKLLLMKTYKVVLHSFAVVHVDAENFGETETTIAFYRAGSVSAEYPRALVREVLEVQDKPHRGNRS
jgi:hypothetical protein